MTDEELDKLFKTAFSSIAVIEGQVFALTVALARVITRNETSHLLRQELKTVASDKTLHEMFAEISASPSEKMALQAAEEHLKLLLKLVRPSRPRSRSFKKDAETGKSLE